MPSIKSWWAGKIDGATPAGQLLQTFLASLPRDRAFHITIYGSAPLQLTVGRQLLSADVDLFSDHDEDLSALIAAAKLDRLDARDLKAFQRVIQLTGHPTAQEFKHELQNAVDLFRPAFDEDAPWHRGQSRPLVSIHFLSDRGTADEHVEYVQKRIR